MKKTIETRAVELSTTYLTEFWRMIIGMYLGTCLFDSVIRYASAILAGMQTAKIIANCADCALLAVILAYNIIMYVKERSVTKKERAM